MLPFLSDLTSQDDFHEMITCCLEAWANQRKNPATYAHEVISEYIKAQKRDLNTLYGKRNISLDQCFGDSKTPAGEFLNLSDWREWGDM